MNVDVTTDAEKLDLSSYKDLGSKGQILVLQNLGPGDVYWDTVAGVSTTNGVKLGTGGGYELRLQDVWVVGSAAADLRVTVMD